MNIRNVLLVTVAIGAMMQGANSACLTSAQLQALGFTASASAAGNTTAPSYCTNLYANGSACIAQADIAAYFDKNDASLQAEAKLSWSFTAIFNSLQNVFTSMAKSLQDVLKSLTAQAANLGTSTNTTTSANTTTSTTTGTSNGTTTSTSTNATIAANATQATAATGNVFEEINTYMETLRVRATNATSDCLSAYYKLNNGLMCYLTSNKATTGVSSSSATSNAGFIVDVKTDTVGDELLKCLPMVDAYCSLVYGYSISKDFPFEDVKYNVTGKVTLNTCTQLRTVYSCNTDACTATKRTIFINDIYSPSDVTFIPEQEMIDKINVEVNGYAANAGAMAKLFGRRLQGNSTQTVRPRAKADGEDIVTDGNSASAPPRTYKTAAVLLSSLAFTFLAIFS